MKKRALKHYRFGSVFAGLKRKLSKRRAFIKKVRNLYLQLGLEDKACSLCGSHDFSLLSEGDRYGFDLKKQLCNNCGLVQTSPALSREFHQEFYSHHYRRLYTGGVETVNYDELIDDQADKGTALVDYLKAQGLNRALNQLAVIEIGCSSGGILNAMKLGVRSVQGCDLDIEAVKYANKTFGIDVEVSTYPSQLPASPRLFVLSHVLEHLYDPLEAFQTIHQMMNEEDYLYIAVPGLNAVAEGDYKHDLRRYFHIAHVTDFTGSTLSSMAVEAGFNTLHVNERVDGLFVTMKDQKDEWARSSNDSVDNILRIEATYKTKFFHA